MCFAVGIAAMKQCLHDYNALGVVCPWSPLLLAKFVLPVGQGSSGFKVDNFVKMVDGIFFMLR